MNTRVFIWRIKKIGSSFFFFFEIISNSSNKRRNKSDIGLSTSLSLDHGEKQSHVDVNALLFQHSCCFDSFISGCDFDQDSVF